jgi:radical SAM superfamily enzyme YgiQ (UPF0313 family)
LDDNIVGDVKFAKELFISLSSLKIDWVGQASMSLVKDKNLLRLAQKSGCIALFFGLESVSPNTLKGLPKALKSLKENNDAIKIIQDSGIMFHASVVFGFDDDDSSIFERTLEFLMKNRIVTVTFNILTPYPGTRIFERFEREGRLLSRNWSDYNHTTVVFKPQKMTPEQLAEGFVWIGKNFYSKSSILKRFFNNFNHPVLYFSMNAAYHQAYKKENSENRVTRC